MTEYITKAQAIDEVWDAFTSRDDPDLGRVIEENIERLPAADVVEVVRCKDCESAYGEDIFNSIRWCNANGIYVGLDDFCSYGARKGDSE